MGTNSSLTEWMPDQARALAARHENVYLETCQATAEQIELAYLDPQIGPDKLIFGSDWGASIGYYRVQGPRGDRTYAATPPAAPPRDLIMHQDWALRQLYAIDMPPNDRAKILGLNLPRLIGLDVKAKLEERYRQKYGPQISVGDVQVDLTWEADP